MKAQSPKFLAFILTDATGWTGFSMNVIAPLIQSRPCEVLINFMTSFVQRFIQDERAGVQASSRMLFCDDSYRLKIEGLGGQAREDAIVSTYSDTIATAGQFACVPTTLILHPTKDGTYFHLVYATRHLRCVVVFKNAERKALKLSETVRANAKRLDRETLSGQAEFFGGADVPERAHLDELKAHTVSDSIAITPKVSYDDI